jgi:ATP-dependent DNA helicase DinG
MAELAPRGPSPRWRIARGDLRPATIHRTELEGALAHLGGECPDEDADFLGFRRRAADISVGLSLIAAAEQPDLVYWAESRGRGLFLRAAPVDIAQELRERLLDRTPGLVFTSATLAAAGSLEFFRTRIGLRGNEAAEAILPSSFDFEEQAALYLPRAVPDPNAPGFGEAAAREIRALCEITGGRAFALFTSYKAMEAAHARLKDDLPWPALLQGERPKQALLRDFKQRPSVLFATASFWEGVDVPGDALSLVIIDRLPFASPGDPLTSARIEHLNAQGFDAFNHYQLPQAALALKQGFGRLIRTRTDRGIVAVLDRRITTRSYGRAFLDTLPQCPRFDDRDALAAWWGKGLTSPAPPALPS